jgi:hypothetical protein
MSSCAQSQDQEHFIGQTRLDSNLRLSLTGQAEPACAPRLGFDKLSPNGFLSF